MKKTLFPDKNKIRLETMEKAIVRKPPIKKRFSLIAFYLGEEIELKKLQERLKHYPFLSREHPILLKLAIDQYALLTKFGVVVFWNVPERMQREFIQEISPFVENFNINYSLSETLKVFLGGKEVDEVRSGRVFLTKLDREKVQIISLVLAQSVALENYEIEIEKRVLEMEKIITALKSGTWQGLKEKNLLRQIGDILAVKQKTISHLSLLDKPETVWERAELEKLYNKLSFELDLRDRTDILNEKIKFLSDHHKILLDFISAQRGNFLELIIIILILIEIFIFFFETFRK